MCGCGRTSMPVPTSRCAGPIWSKNRNGPTMVRGLDGKVRWTLKPPRSCVVGVIVCSTKSSSTACLQRGEHLGEILGKDGFGPVGQLVAGEPAMRLHHAAFELGMRGGVNLSQLSFKKI